MTGEKSTSDHTVLDKFYFLPFPAIRVFQEWIRNRFGVFPERGFPGDALFPELTPELLVAEASAPEWNQGCQELKDLEAMKHLSGNDTKVQR